MNISLSCMKAHKLHVQVKGIGIGIVNTGPVLTWNRICTKFSTNAHTHLYLWPFIITMIRIIFFKKTVLREFWGKSVWVQPFWCQTNHITPCRYLYSKRSSRLTFNLPDRQEEHSSCIIIQNRVRNLDEKVTKLEPRLSSFRSLIIEVKPVPQAVIWWVRQFCCKSSFDHISFVLNLPSWIEDVPARMLRKS